MKETEKRHHLSESALQWQATFDATNDAIWILDKEQRVVRSNKTAERYFQRTTEQMIGVHCWEIVHGTKEPVPDCPTLRTHISLKREKMELYAGGRWLEVVVDPLLDGAGEFTGAVHIVSDITDRKQAEENLAQIFQMSLDMICIADINSATFVKVNPAFTEILGYSEEELLGRPFLDYILPEDVEPTLAVLEEKLQRGEKVINFQNRYLCQDGSYRWLNWVSHPVPEKGLTYAVAHDVTEQKHMEEALGEREAFLQNVFDAIQDGVSVLDKELRILRVNRWMEKMYPHELPLAGRKCYAVYQGRETPCPWCPTLKTFGTGETHSEVVPYPSEEDPGGWIELTAFPLKDAQGKTIRVIEYVKDITRQKRAEEGLQQSEERYRSLVENTLDGYFICELPSGRFIFLNQSICDLNGYTMQEGLQLSIWDVVDPEEHPYIRERIQVRMDGREPTHASHTYTAIRKDGSKYRAEVSTSLVTYLGRPVMQGVLRDVTEEEKLRLQLQQAQKMEAIGTLAGGIAHDFNNLLMGIQGRTSLMMSDMDPASAYVEHLRGIEDYIRSATDLTRQLLGLARGGKYEVKTTDMNDLILKSSQMFARTRKEIKIHRKLKKDLWSVSADQRQMEQIFLNLYINAWQAMPAGGELYLQTENVILDRDSAKAHSVPPGRYVKISITDNGIGMDEATRRKVFEPFFTTKGMGRGSGLGLASAYGIVKNHEGIINVYSEKGQGTTFTIYLPASEKMAVQETEAARGLLKGSETVLLVDDEQMVLDVGEPMLGKLGYRVLKAAGGHAALRLYMEKKDEIDVVILDMIMPDMHGGETYERLKEIDPEIKVLLSSGYSINGQAQKILQKGCKGFIQKPFNLDELSHKLREVLDS